MSESQQLQNFTIPGTGYGYKAAPIDTLQSFENTIALGLFDESGSTEDFAIQMQNAVKEIVKSLQQSPRADNLIYRQCHFGTNFREFHGFLPLNQLVLSDYDHCYQPGGRTHLYDSLHRVTLELVDYARQQAQQRYMCNAILYAITDGADYGSTLKIKDVKNGFSQAIACEDLESLVTILIGVNDDPGIQQNLQDFAKEAGFTRYVPIGQATEKELAKMANFISQSISSQSQALGTGGPSQQINSLTF